MANRTAKDAHSVKGTNPQFLVEKIIRTRIYESRYWKEECFALTAELLVDKAMALEYIGGVFGGNTKATPFLCLILKMLQIQPEKDIVVEFIKNEDYKYVRCLGAMYLRLVGTALDCYKYLEPLYNDYRKLKRRLTTGSFELIHVDEFIDELLQSDRVCDVILPRIQKRQVLEQCEQLDPRVSALDDDLDDVDDAELEELQRELRDSPGRSPSPDHRHRGRRSVSPRRRSYSPDHRRRHSPAHRRRSRSRSPHRRYDRGIDRGRSRYYDDERHDRRYDDDRRDRRDDDRRDRYDDDRRDRHDDRRDRHEDRHYRHREEREYDKYRESRDYDRRDHHSRHKEDRNRGYRDERDRDRDHRRR